MQKGHRKAKNNLHNELVHLAVGWGLGDIANCHTLLRATDNMNAHVLKGHDTEKKVYLFYGFTTSNSFLT